MRSVNVYVSPRLAIVVHELNTAVALHPLTANQLAANPSRGKPGAISQNPYNVGSVSKILDF